MCARSVYAHNGHGERDFASPGDGINYLSRPLLLYTDGVFIKGCGDEYGVCVCVCVEGYNNALPNLTEPQKVNVFERARERPCVCVCVYTHIDPVLRNTAATCLFGGVLSVY